VDSGQGGLPRRVSVWSPESGLVRDYTGTTSYSGTRCYLHDSDPSVAYAGPVGAVCAVYARCAGVEQYGLAKNAIPQQNDENPIKTHFSATKRQKYFFLDHFYKNST
jgi:hypothetical protein